jgi:hypothetical protein
VYRMWSFLLLACTGTDAESGKPDDSGSVTDTDTADTDTTDDSGTTDTRTASLTGSVVGPDGSPLEGAAVNVCRMVCYRQNTDAAGAYVYDALEAWTASFYVIPAVGSGLATAMAPITWAEDEDKVIDVQMLELDDTHPIPATAAEVEVTDGLWLTLGMDTLTPPFGIDLVDTAAVRVPVEDRLPLEVPGEVLDVWYLHPWESESEEGVPLRIANTWSLTPGETVRAWVSSLPLDYSWLDAGTLTVSEDGTMLEGDAELPVLTSLVLTRE